MKPAFCATQTVLGQNLSPRRGRKMLFFVILLMSFYWIWLKISNPQTFPVHSVKIVGKTTHINHTQLRNTIAMYLSRGMLWLDAHTLENTLNQLPWIEQATLTRKWPDELVIYITEQTPIAHWNNTQLLNTQGKVFTPDTSTSLPFLPAFYGPDNLQNTVWSYYQAMNKTLNTAELKVTTITLTPRGTWNIYLTNGLHLILGKEKVLHRLKLFASLYPKIKTQINNIDSIDLRYNDGFAVKWKNNSPSY